MSDEVTTTETEVTEPEVEETTTEETPDETPAEAPDESTEDASDDTDQEDNSEADAEDQDETPAHEDPEQIKLALQFIKDPENEQFETAKAILEAAGLEDYIPDEEDIFDEDEPEEGSHEWLVARERAREEKEQAAQRQEQERKASEAFFSDLKTTFGADFPTEADKMSADQKTQALLTLGHGDSDAPAEAAKALLDERDAALTPDRVPESVKQQIIDDYVNGKADPSPTPITDRTASHAAGDITNAEAAVADVARSFINNAQAA